MTCQQLIKAHLLRNSDSQIRDNTTSDFRSNRETTDDGRGYEVINAKEFHKETEFNQFESMKDNTISNKSDNSPMASNKFSNTLKDKSSDKANPIPKHPDSHKKAKSKGPTSRIPGVKKPNSVVRTNNIIPQEEGKRHKGKTPSFGNSNAPLFLNNFQIDAADISSENNTPSYNKKEEAKTDRRSLNKIPSTELTDKFTAPILSHREMKKTQPKKPSKQGYRTRPLSKKASPNVRKHNPIGNYTPKPAAGSKENCYNVIDKGNTQTYDNKSGSDTKSATNDPAKKGGRRQQSLGDKAARRTPIAKNKGKTPRNEFKESIPFEYQKDSASGKKGGNKRTSSRSPRDSSPKLHFMSPTACSKHKQSNQK